MADPAAVLRGLAADFAALHVPFSLVGALAVSARTRPRFTKDVDVVAAVADDPGAELLVRNLAARGYRSHSAFENEATRRLALVRFVAPHSPAFEPEVDILFSSSGIEDEVIRSSDPLVVLGSTVPVASIGHLLALKTLSQDDTKRPQDRVDLVALLEIATPADRAEAERALERITRLGCNRSKDLRAIFKRLCDR